MAHPGPAHASRTPLGELELQEALSSSFFGVRYRARSLSTGRSGTHALGTVARHTVPPTISSELRAVRVVCVDASDVIERLALAATAVRDAGHPGLITPLRIVRERARLGIVTNDVAGVTLAELVERAAARQEGLPQAIVLRIVLDLLEGLRALEATMATPELSQCLYGGLTPDSIHVGRDGQTRVLDPGVMAAAARQGAWTLDPRMLAYSAPELHAAGARHDARVDTFAVGVVLWELLSCRSLFLAPSAHETIEAVCRTRVDRVRRQRFVRGEPITAAVANVVARALDREPARRFQSYGELVLALREAAPVAELKQVAAFVTAGDPETRVQAPALDGDPHVPATLPPPRGAEEAAEVLVDVPDPIAIEPEPIDAVPPTEVAAVLTPAPSTSPRQLASGRRRRAAWALGVILLVAAVAFALRNARQGGESEHPAQSAQPAPEPVTRARGAERGPGSPRAASAEPAAASASPTASPPATPLPAASAAAPEEAPDARRPRSASRKKSPKRPFIPDDI